jgi:hypothetical protein
VSGRQLTCLCPTRIPQIYQVLALQIVLLRYYLSIMSQTALFVVDIQNDMANDPKTEIPHAARIRDVGAKILVKARAVEDNSTLIDGGSKMSIVFVQHEESPGDGPLVKGMKPWELVFDPRKGAGSERLVAKTTRQILSLLTCDTGSLTANR